MRLLPPFQCEATGRQRFLFFSGNFVGASTGRARTFGSSELPGAFSIPSASLFVPIRSARGTVLADVAELIASRRYVHPEKPKLSTLTQKMQPMNSTIIAVTILLTTSLTACAATLSVDAIDNIYGAGHSTPPAPSGGSPGTLPPGVFFPASPGQVVTFTSVTGTATVTAAFGLVGPDGNTSFGMNLSSYGGISGIKTDVSSFLVGVFLGAAEPLDPAPALLDFTAAGLGTAFTSLSPLINQMFYIGDGLTGTGSGSQQQFNVPSSATAFYLGFADASGYSGPPGQYQDNDGTLTATFIGVVPESSSGALLLGACAALVATRRRNPNDRNG